MLVEQQMCGDEPTRRTSPRIALQSNRASLYIQASSVSASQFDDANPRLQTQGQEGVSPLYLLKYMHYVHILKIIFYIPAWAYVLFNCVFNVLFSTTTLTWKSLSRPYCDAMRVSSLVYSVFNSFSSNSRNALSSTLRFSRRVSTARMHD